MDPIQCVKLVYHVIEVIVLLTNRHKLFRKKSLCKVSSPGTKSLVIEDDLRSLILRKDKCTYAFSEIKAVIYVPIPLMKINIYTKFTNTSWGDDDIEFFFFLNFIELRFFILYTVSDTAFYLVHHCVMFNEMYMYSLSFVFNKP